MKNILILFLLFTVTGFAQNYYPLDKAPDTETPTTPLNLVASNISETTVDLTWSAATDNVAVTNYSVYNNGSLLVAATGNVTNYTLTGLTANTIYNITIRAIDAAGNESTGSNTETFTTNNVIIPDTESPTAPLNLIANNVSETTVDLTWSTAIDNIAVTNYSVYNNGNLLVDATGNVTNYTLTGLTANTIYNITIRAIDAAGNESTGSNTETFTTNNVIIPDTESPTAPLNLIANNVSETTVDLTWTAATDNVTVTNYAIYNNNIFITNTGNVTSYQLKGLIEQTLYNLTVRAIDGSQNESVDSNIETFTTSASSFTATRFILMGDSITNATYGNEAEIENKITAEFPNETVSVHNEGSSGQSIWSYSDPGEIDTRLAKYTDTPTIQTFCIVMLGTNDARQLQYDNNTGIQDRRNKLNYIIDAIEAKGFIPILLDAPFSPFVGTFPGCCGDAYADENVGTKPYNDNIIIPIILARTPNYAFSDGQSYMQPYNFFYNGHTLNPSYSGDGVHPSGTGYSAFKDHFVNTIVRYIFTGIPPTKIVKNGETTENQPEEDLYLNSYLLPLSQKSEIQTALDTYGSVKLETGDYRGVNITMTSGQKLYGHPSLNKISTINIAAGSSDVIISNFDVDAIEFQSGAPITNCLIQNLDKSIIRGTNCQIENIEFLNVKSIIDFDCSASGYIRNSQFKRSYNQGSSPQLTLKGNNNTPSYGLVFMWYNFLTPADSSTDIDNIELLNMIGVDAEGWNLFGTQGYTDAMLYMRNMGDVKLATINGANSYSTVKTAVFDIDADNVNMIYKNIGNAGPNNTIRNDTNLFLVRTNDDDIDTGTGTIIKTHDNNQDAEINGVNRTSPITDTTLKAAVTNVILGTELTPIARPTYNVLPDPLGPNWATDRIGQTDQTAYIQGLIDANGVAKLPEGIYYIGSTLNVSEGEGIIGSGTGKTVICGLTDDFPLITATGDNTSVHVLKYITLQGGQAGWKYDRDGSTNFQPTATNFEYIVFRDQDYGIWSYRIFGIDNVFYSNLGFINCGIGLYQETDPSYTGGTTDNMSYIDKMVMYKNQFINCGIGVSMLATRADNLNAWIDCKFDGCGIAAELKNNNSPFFANCDFTNTTGDYVVGRESAAGFYSCNFYNNNTTDIFLANALFIEGCDFSDNIDLFSDSKNTDAYILNSTVVGALGSIEDGIIANSNLQSDATFSKILVNVSNGTPTVIIDDTPNPYPQYLIKK